MPEQIIENAEKKGLADFVKLMQNVAALPKEQQEKVTYFAQGVIAASSGILRKASNE